MRVGFIGVGEIGGPMVDNLLSGGVHVTAFARREEVAQRLAVAGAQVVASAAEVGLDADMVGLCPFSDEQVQELALDDRGLLESMSPGAVLVNHTTGRPSTARRLAEAAGSRGVHVLDAPVSGTVQHARDGHITLLVGGETCALDRVRPALECYANPIIHLGPVGNGQATKLINNALLGVNVKILVEAERLVRALGVPSGALARALGHASGGSRVAEVAVELGSIEAMTSYLRPYLQKDVNVVREVAGEMGLDLGLIARVLDSGEQF